MTFPAQFIRQAAHVAFTCAVAASAGQAAAQELLTTRCEGGLGLNAIKGPEQVEACIASIKRIRAPIEDPKDPVTTHLTTHAFSNGLTEAKEPLKGRKPGDLHPLVDPRGFREQLDALQAGAEQRLLVERAKKPS